jgi:hypothetical protein
MVRKWVIFSLAAGVLVSVAPPMAYAGTAGRRNTAIATTALAVGAWSNGTGRKGRRNTAILATGAAAYSWKRYNDKKKEQRRPARRTVVLASNGRPRQVVTHVHHVRHERCSFHPGRGRGHHKCKWHKHHKHHRHHRHHD